MTETPRPPVLLTPKHRETLIELAREYFLPLRQSSAIEAALSEIARLQGEVYVLETLLANVPEGTVARAIAARHKAEAQP